MTAEPVEGARLPVCVVVDHQTICRLAIVRSLDHDGRTRVLASAASADALQAGPDDAVDVVVLGIDRDDAHQQLAALRRRWPAAAVVTVDGDVRTQDVARLLDAVAATGQARSAADAAAPVASTGVADGTSENTHRR